MKQNKYKILVVDSDTHAQKQVTKLLENAGYQVILANSCQNGKTLYTSYLPDLILTERAFADADGMQLVEFVRKDSLTPILILSIRTDKKDIVSALDTGANDYITKPFDAEELLARVRVALRNHRSGAHEGRLPGGKFVCQELEIHYDARQVFINHTPVRLTQTEYNILVLLSENCGKMMSYAAMIKAIWGEYAQESTIKKLQVNMANIRRKLGAPSYIENATGVGYRLNQ